MLEQIIIAFFMIAILMLIAWGIFLWQKNAGIIDVFWPISITIVGLYYSINGEPSITKFLIQTLLVIWMLRLAGYLLIARIFKKKVDPRYENLSQKWKMSKQLGFLFNFQFQGALAILIATPFLFIANVQTLNLQIFIAFLLIIIGLIGESVSDFQLQQFKQHKLGPVCNTGLWQYSRHPNYFFEWIIWVGFFVAGLSFSPITWLGIISPVLLLLLMLKLTGPITEAGSLKSRGEAYRAYQKKTSMFLLLPPKKDK